ncbi:MAG TPA: hypothetical protein C5S37_01445, partial [Methanophagales archaeon]|nr:hypothetical protein [Methanophagales archaeon]
MIKTNQKGIAILVILVLIGIAFVHIGMTDRVKIPSKIEGTIGQNETNKVPESTEVPSNPEKIGENDMNEMPGNPFLSKDAAEKIAKSKLGEHIPGDPIFELWKQSVLGDPILVRTVEEEPSYWSVPVIFNKDKVIGFIDVEGDGTISRYGLYGHCYADNLSRCPSVLTLITAEEAAELAEEITARYPDAEVSEPIFVHDGAKSKIAWMLKIEKNGEIISRVFVSGRSVYERKEGEFSAKSLRIPASFLS